MNTTTITRQQAFATLFSTPALSRQAIASITAGVGATSKDAGRDILTHCLISHDEGELKIISTDSYRANRVRLSTLNDGTMPPIMVKTKTLLDALPKRTVFKDHGTARLQLRWFPGERELDSGQLHICWDNEQRIVPAYPNGGSAGHYAEVEKLINESIADTQITNETTGWDPDKLKDMAVEARLVIGKGREPVRMTPGATPLKPAIFTVFVEGCTYESLLMPVRIP